MNPPALDRALFISELAKRWRCRRSEIDRLLKDGTLQAIHFGRSLRILPESIIACERGPLAAKVQKRIARRVDPEILRLLG